MSSVVLRHVLKVGYQLACLRQSAHAGTPAWALRKLLMISRRKIASPWGCPHMTYGNQADFEVF